MLPHDRNSAATTSFRVPPAPGYAPPISDKGVGRWLVRMLADAVERGDYVEALKVTRGAEIHFSWVSAHSQAVTK